MAGVSCQMLFPLHHIESVRQTSDQRGYEVVAEQVDITSRDATVNALRDYAKKSGVYFWVCEFDKYCVAAYVGRTNNLLRRITEYSSNYQPHSPNDFKLRIFWHYCETRGANRLSLYFKPAEESDRTLAAQEKEEIRALNPFLNKRQVPTAEARDCLLKAFEDYYVSAFHEVAKVGS